MTPDQPGQSRVMQPRSPGMRLQHALDRFADEARRAVAEAEGFRECSHDSALSMGQLVREHREALGLTLQELGDRAGCTKSHIWEIEQGRSRNPTVRMVHGIATGLGLPVMVLVRAALRDSPTPARAPEDGR